jgi:predicted kinase
LSAVDMPRLIHLNGAPGIGKSTLAARYGDEHRGVLRCDIDALRTMIGGWEYEEQAASRARTIALAMITAYLRTGGDVVLPQLVARRDQLERFRRAAEDGGGEHVHIMLLASPAATIQRFRARAAEATDHWIAHATASWDELGGDGALRALIPTLEGMKAVQVPSTTLDDTYARLLAALRSPPLGKQGTDRGRS